VEVKAAAVVGEKAAAAVVKETLAAGRAQPGIRQEGVDQMLRLAENSWLAN
jgi:hypothetical protein